MGKVYLALVLLLMTVVFGAAARQIEAVPADIFNKKNQTSRIEFQKSKLPTASALGALTTGDAAVDGYIVESCARYNVDPLLIFAQMNQESRFKQKATSHKGASGLMQLMPDTARRFGVTNIYDPQQNIDAGVKYMRWLLDKFEQDVRLSLAAYNAGEGAVMKYGNQIPPYRETQTYVAKITTQYAQIKTPAVASSVVRGNAVLQQVSAVLK